MSTTPRVVIIGAGIVGANLADELTERGWDRITVVDQGPLPLTGGSTSHAPGLVFQTNSSKTMTEFATYTVNKLKSIDVDGAWCFNQVGGLEIATTPERLADLHRRQGWATSWGVQAEVISAEECVKLHPLVDREQVLGGLHIPTDGLAKATRTVVALTRRAQARGAVFRGNTRVTGIEHTGGRVTGVRTDDGVIPADIVVSCAGFWGVELGAMVGMAVPLLPLAHQFVWTGQVPDLVGRNTELQEAEPADPAAPGPGPVLPGAGRLPGHRLLRPPADAGGPAHPPRGRGDRGGHAIGAAVHRGGLRPGLGAEQAAAALAPAVQDRFRVQRHLLLHPRRRPAGRRIRGGEGFLDRRGGLGDPFRRRRQGGGAVAGRRPLRNRAARLRCAPFRGCPAGPGLRQRNVPAELRRDLRHPAPVAAQGISPEPAGQPVPRPAGSNLAPCSWRAPAGSGRTGTSPTPRWSTDLPAEWAPPARDSWSAKFHSPIAAAEAWKTRTAVAMYDMTPLKRLEVSGPGALDLLQRVTSGQMDKTVGAVTYALMLDQAGGIRSDVTVARLGEQLFQVGANSALDFDYLRRQAPADGSVHIRDITGGTCCIGLWGPLAREVIGAVSSDDFTNEGLKYFRAKQVRIGGVSVTAMRLSYVGELGWELYTTADNGQRLWDVLWAAGQPHGVVAAGRAAFNSLRLEKGYRSWGTDMTTEYNPYEAGLGFAVSPRKESFIGRDALTGVSDDTVTRRLTCLTVDDGRSVVLGSGTGVRRRPGRRVRHQRRLRAHHRQADRLRLAAGVTERRRRSRDPVLRQPRRGHRHRGTAGRPEDDPPARLSRAHQRPHRPPVPVS